MESIVNADAFNAFEAAGWADRAGAYVRTLAPVTGRVIEPLLAAAQVGPGDRVLDVGTGSGHVAAASAALGASATGVDIAEEMVALARHAFPDVTFRQGDAQQLPFDDASMDVVLGNFSILHLGRPESAAREFARVLTPGGRVALSTWDVPARTRLLGIVLDAVEEVGAKPPPSLPAGPPFFRYADDAAFSGLLSGAGFTRVAVETVGFSFRCPSSQTLWDLLINGTVRTRAIVSKQPDHVQAQIRTVFDRLATRYASADGIDVPVSVKIASGVRGEGGAS